MSKSREVVQKKPAQQKLGFMFGEVLERDYCTRKKLPEMGNFLNLFVG
jgi:hypothetical protein